MRELISSQGMASAGDGRRETLGLLSPRRVQLENSGIAFSEA
jgi:hypothetical protein